MKALRLFAVLLALVLVSGLVIADESLFHPAGGMILAPIFILLFIILAVFSIAAFLCLLISLALFFISASNLFFGKFSWIKFISKRPKAVAVASFVLAAFFALINYFLRELPVFFYMLMILAFICLVAGIVLAAYSLAKIMRGRKTMWRFLNETTPRKLLLISVVSIIVSSAFLLNPNCMFSVSLNHRYYCTSQIETGITDFSECGNLEYNGLRDKCAIRLAESPQDCNTFEGWSFAHTQELNCIEALAVRRDDPEICKLIQYENMRNSCIEEASE